MVTFFVPQKEVRPKAKGKGPSKVYVGEQARFNGRKSSDKDGRIVAYRWNFGDGATAKGSVVTHSYQKPGQYQVKLVVTDNDNLKAEDNLQIEVIEDPHDPPNDPSDGRNVAPKKDPIDGPIALSQLDFHEFKSKRGVLTLDKLAVGDFNQDSKLDLAVTTKLGGQVLILLGSGNGRFHRTTNLPIGGQPESIALGDITGNGTQDLLFAFPEKKAISILPGRGDGSFGQLSTIPVKHPPTGLAVGDFNNDGLNDLAVSSQAADSIIILLRTKKGSYQESCTIKTKVPSSIVSGNYNEDRLLDLAILSKDKLLMAAGNGDGTFKSPYEIQTLQAKGVQLAQGDFTRDGSPDLVVMRVAGGSMIILTVGDKGTAEEAVEFQTGFDLEAIAAGDLDGDGISDIAVTKGGSARITIFIAAVNN